MLVVGVVVVVGAAKLNLVEAPRKRISVESPEVDRESNVFVNGTVAVRLDAVALAALTVTLLVLIWKLSEVKFAQSPCGAIHCAVPSDLTTAVNDLRKVEPRKSRTSTC